MHVTIFGHQVVLCALYMSARYSRFFLHKGQQYTVFRGWRGIHVGALLWWKYGTEIREAFAS